jgi:hypothetical protein
MNSSASSTHCILGFLDLATPKLSYHMTSIIQKFFFFNILNCAHLGSKYFFRHSVRSSLYYLMIYLVRITEDSGGHSRLVKVNGKLFRFHAIQAQRGCSGVTPQFLASPLVGGMVNFTSKSLYRWERTPVPTELYSRSDVSEKRKISCAYRDSTTDSSERD